MKAIKTLGVVVLFAIVIYMALGLKKRIVQNTCNSIGDYKATKGEDVVGSSSDDSWYCCPKDKDISTDACVFYGD